MNAGPDSSLLHAAACCCMDLRFTRFTFCGPALSLASGRRGRLLPPPPRPSEPARAQTTRREKGKGRNKERAGTRKGQGQGQGGCEVRSTDGRDGAERAEHGANESRPRGRFSAHAGTWSPADSRARPGQFIGLPPVALYSVQCLLACTKLTAILRLPFTLLPPPSPARGPPRRHRWGRTRRSAAPQKRP